MAVQEYTLEVLPSLGQNTAVNVSDIPKGAQRRAINAVMREINTICKRDGSIPVTTNALNPIKHLTDYQFPNMVAAGIAPTLSAVAGTSTLPAATYYVVYTYVTDDGETEASPESSQAIVLTETLHIIIPAIPYHANSINIYISTATNTETLRYNQTALTKDVTTPLPAAGVAYPTVNITAYSSELLASAGTMLYSYYNGQLRAATMTNALESSDIYTVGFTDLSLVSILFIADGGDLKKYDGNVVITIVPAADDTPPAAANGMAAINLLNPIYTWVHAGHLFVSDGKDVAYYSKQFVFDYFPVTYYERWVNNNDYMTGPGVSFGDVCVIPMRRHWAVLTGTAFGSFAGNKFLNTVNGNIAPRGIAKITYPDGSQTVGYLSDDGPYEIYDTLVTDASGAGSRNYATRPLMKDKINFSGIGFTESEKTLAYMEFDSVSNLLKLKIQRNTTNYMFVMDVRNREWYQWQFPNNIQPSIRYSGISYFAGSTGLLHKFDEDLYTDYDTAAQTTGTIVDFDVYSGLLSFEFSGDASYLHYYLCEAKQWTVRSTLDVAIIYGAGIQTLESALRNEVFVWGVSAWNEAEWANLDYTDIVNNAKRLVFHKKAKYFQRRWRNNRDEPVTILKEKFIGTVSGRL